MCLSYFKHFLCSEGTLHVTDLRPIAFSLRCNRVIRKCYDAFLKSSALSLLHVIREVWLLYLLYFSVRDVMLLEKSLRQNLSRISTQKNH